MCCIYNKKGRFIGEMIHEGEMANKKHLIETKLGYYKNKLHGVQVKTILKYLKTGLASFSIFAIFSSSPVN
jgi:hypothetical protein